MKALLWRNDHPLYDYPATFSSLSKHTMGGTCSQVLWHALGFKSLGFDVQVLGCAETDLEEEGIDFVGASDRDAQMRLLDSGRIMRPDIVLMEGAYHGGARFKQRWPDVPVCHVGQSSEPGRRPGSFDHDHEIDFYLFVSVGHFMFYVYRYPALAHKFVLLRNVSPYDYFADAVREPEDSEVIRVAWLGAWLKPGLREWSDTMSNVMRRRPDVHWELYGPAYGKGVQPSRDYLEREFWFDVDLPGDRVFVRSVPLPELLSQLRGCRFVITSLGSETACISAMDAHACGRPVVSGADGVYKIVNPESSGLRVHAAEDRLRAADMLIQDKALADLLGDNARDLYQRDFSFATQRRDLQELVATANVFKHMGGHSFCDGRGIHANLVYAKAVHWARKLARRQRG